MRYMEQLKKKISTWLIDLGLRISGSDRRSNAAKDLGLSHGTVLLAERLQSHGTEPFCLRQLGLTKGDLDFIREARKRKGETRTTIKGVPLYSSFNKFAEWAGNKHVTARAFEKNYNLWKTQGESSAIKSIKKLLDTDLSEGNLAKLALNVFHLYWLKEYHKRPKYKPKNNPS